MNDTMIMSSVVPAYETGPDDRMHYHWLMCRLQEAATMHADREGFGVAQLGGKNCFWVLTSMRIEIKKLPRREKNFSLTTWSKGAKRLRAFREFSGCDESGNEIVRASSEWMILDSETGKPLNIDLLGLDLLPKTESIFKDELKRIRPGKPENELNSFRIPYSSLDASGHVNNTEYLRWGMDALRTYGAAPKNINSIRIAFLSEVFEGNTLKIMGCEKNQQKFELIGFNETENKTAFALQVQ
ncbi:acyl-[acyl-carrier-protein] thioesterase [Maridesulfovibrio ferrireducens]|uniref:acyl-[acyl-carrier-protein] thioesterase n=1 Tax=Maridesulfovibrio ferrireducens TaxID=246191 RepID=UPI001A266E15|nr:acyl-ACP thioesterase domain-containing protein [Maridesulfovibrio ferrireducens]MBI9112844.1 acyl-ACP thioesterase [Maridesulfovibrio ferrireducens]